MVFSISILQKNFEKLFFNYYVTYLETIIDLI